MPEDIEGMQLDQRWSGDFVFPEDVGNVVVAIVSRFLVTSAAFTKLSLSL